MKVKIYKYEEVLEIAVFEVLQASLIDKKLSNKRLQELNYEDVSTLLYRESIYEYKKAINKELKKKIKELTQDGLYDDKSTPKVKYLAIDRSLLDDDMELV